MSTAIPVGTNTSNLIVTRQRKKRDLETTMTALKQLLEPTMRKGSRKKNKPRSIAKKVIPPKRVSRFENPIDVGEYYPNKLKRKVRINKTVLRPKQDLKVVVATNKRKRCTPHKGLDSGVLTNSEPDNTFNSILYTNIVSKNESSNSSMHLQVQTTPDYKLNVQALKINTQNSMYKLISPPHKSLTQLTVDDLIRMDEDSLSSEDMMEILTCPSPVWWEEPADVNQGTVYLTQASELSTPAIKHSEVNTKQERNGLKRGSICVSASKARKIAKLENILGHIKSLVRDGETIKNIDSSNKNKDSDSVNKVDKIKPFVNLEAVIDKVNKPEVNKTDRKRRHISSSGSEISINEDELLRNLENIDIPIENQMEDSRKNCDDKPTNIKAVDNINDNEKEQKNTVAAQNKKPQRGKKKNIKKKKVSPVTKKQMKSKQLRDNERFKKDAKNNEEKEKPPEHDDQPKALEKNDDILDVRLIKVPTNITNEVKVWSTLENFKRHHLTPSEFQGTAITIEDEYEIPIKTKKNKQKEKDPLEINDETILIDDDSNDFDVETGIDVVSINVIEPTHVTISPVTDKSCSDKEVCSTKDTIEFNEEISGDKETREEINIIKEDTIRIGNDLDIKLIETSDVHEPRDTHKVQNNVEISKVKSIPRQHKSIEVVASTHLKETSNWHVNDYLKFDDKTNDRGIFRVEDTDDATDTILCLNDVNVSIVKNPRLKKDKNEVKVNESINDLSITLVSKSAKGTLTILPKLTKVMESPKSIKSNTSDSTIENSDTISDTNIHFIDEYDDRNVHKIEKIDPEFKGNIIHLELVQDTTDNDYSMSEDIQTFVDNASTDCEDNVNIDEGKNKL